MACENITEHLGLKHMQGSVICMLVADRRWLTIWRGDWPDDTLWGLEPEVSLARGWAAKTYKRSNTELPSRTPDGRRDDCQPLKAAVAEVFWSMMLTRTEARSLARSLARQ